MAICVFFHTEWARRAAALPLWRIAFFSYRMGQGRRARGGPTLFAHCVFSIQNGARAAARVAALPHLAHCVFPYRMGQGRRACGGPAPLAHCAFPYKMGQGRRATALPLAHNVISQSECPRAAARAAAWSLARTMYSHWVGMTRTKRLVRPPTRIETPPNTLQNSYTHALSMYVYESIYTCNHVKITTIIFPSGDG